MSNWLKLGISSLFLFSGAAYMSYKHNTILQFQQDLQNNQNNLKQFMYNIHQSMAFKIDKSLDNYDRSTPKISQYRKTLLSYAQGLILETGVGTSRNLLYYPQNTQVIGIDWSPNMIEVAVQKISPLNIEMSYRIDDVEKMNFKDNTFDTVVDTFGLEYYVNPSKALNEMKRVCKKDGKILILAGGLSWYDYLNKYIEYKAPYTVINCGYFPNRNWEDFIKQEDFEIEKFEKKLNGTIYFYILKNSKK